MKTDKSHLMLLKLGCFPRHCLSFEDETNKALTRLQKNGGMGLGLRCMCNWKCVTMTALLQC